MLAIIADGGVERFDDLHIDEVDSEWKDRREWVSGGLEAHRIAVALRNQHQIPYVVALAFSLRADGMSQPVDFHTTEELGNLLDWSPPSLYLFDRERIPHTASQVHNLPPVMFGTQVRVETAYLLAFSSAGLNESVRSVVIEG